MRILVHRNNLPCRQAHLSKKTVHHHRLHAAGRVLEALVVTGVPHRVVGLRPREDPLMLPLWVAFFLLTLTFPWALRILTQAPNPSAVLGVFGLSIRTQERDLEEQFNRFGRVEKVTIVYDQRVGSSHCPRTTMN